MMSKWQRLNLPEREGLPPLLYKYSGTSKGYEIYITDLTLVWSEQLSNRQIRKRADEDDTTIDPNEDSEQFKVLLQKIEEALCSSPGSSMALSSGAKTDSLELHITTKLPAPLRPLKWNIYLSKELLTAVTNHLLLPLLREEKDRESRQRTLLDQLKHKDWVLGRLFDKIEAMGIELSTIFPGTSGLRGARKETSLAQAAKYIRGVAPFDEQAWLDEMSKSSPESGLTSNILKEFSGSDPASDLEKVHPSPDRWWESLDIRSTAAVSPGPKERKETLEPEPSATKDTGQMDLDTASEDDDDEFERQETPPRFKQQQPPKKEPQPSKKPEPEQPGGRKSPSLPPQKAGQKPSKGLGKIGGAKAKPKPKPKSPSPQPEPEPEPKEPSLQPPSTRSSSADLEEPPSRPARPVKTPSATPSDQPTDSDAASDKDENRQPTPPPQPSPPKPEEKEPRQKKPRGGLGVIGGKNPSKEPTPPSPAPSSPTPEPSKSASPLPPPQSQQPKPKRAGKLGVIGGGKKSKTPKPETKPEPAPRASLKHKSESKSPSPPGIGIRPKQESQEEKPKIKKPEPEPEKEETELEKADRKREELKKQLEAKSKAPAKKKRKF